MDRHTEADRLRQAETDRTADRPAESGRDREREKQTDIQAGR